MSKKEILCVSVSPSQLRDDHGVGGLLSNCLDKSVMKPEYSTRTSPGRTCFSAWWNVVELGTSGTSWSL